LGLPKEFGIRLLKRQEAASISPRRGSS
jgi:hypothetical protein